MPRASAITPELVREVVARRAAGEPFKVIAADLRRRGLPADRATWWRAGVAQRMSDCMEGGDLARHGPCIPT